MPYKDPTKRKEYHRGYMRKHPQKLTDAQKDRKKVYMKKFKEQNKKFLAEYQSRREQENPNRKFYKYQKSAQLRDIQFFLSLEEFSELLTKNCHYCARERAWGVDRVDNFDGYYLDNVVSCCKTCNYMKNNLSYDNFIVHIKQIADRFS